MNPIKIVTDSTCDIPLDLLESKNVDMISLNVLIGGKSYLDLRELQPEKLFELVKKYNELPKTSAIPIAVFEENFEKYVNSGYDVIFMGIDSKISRTYESALQAAKKYPERVYVIDSVNLSSATGLQILKMVKMRDEGLSAKEIVRKMKQITPNVQCSFAVETMDYLYKGGRCSGLKFFFGKVFHIHPIIRMEDGVLTVHHTPRGKMKKALDLMIQEFKEIYDQGKVDLDTILITHACAYESCDYIYRKLSEFVDPKFLLPTHAGCIISSHCGSGTIGIIYLEKE